MQTLLIFLLFIGALSYLGWRAYRSLSRRDEPGCGKGCGCAADKPTTIVVKASK